MNKLTTPDYITSLQPNEIFVFGSNLQGAHGGGAARIAYEKFGAEWGVGVGRTGQCYAIPTMQDGVETIRPYVDEFIRYAQQNQDLIFLVTRIGCGIAGFTDEQVSPLFEAAHDLPNVALPDGWRKKQSIRQSTAEDIESLLEYTRFYKGEDQCPEILKEFEGMHALYWDYENVWVHDELHPDEYYKGAHVYFQRYIQNGKTLRNDVPFGLQAIFANRIEHWTGEHTTLEAVNRFIDEYLKAAKEYEASKEK